MIINNSDIKTEADNMKATIIGDAIINAFGAHKVNFTDFSADYSGVFGNAGSIIRVPLIGRTGGVKTANADGTDDFSIGTKETNHVDLELSLKYVTCPLTIGELETGAQLSDWATSLANDVVEDVQKTLETEISLNGVQCYKVGSADDFTAATLTKKIRPVIRKGAGAEPVCYLDGKYYAAVIPMDKDGFDPSKPHYGFTKICEYTPFQDSFVGFAACKDAVAIASRIPQSIMNNPAYITKYAYQIPELGINVLYAEWANPNNGTMTAGIFYCLGMKVVNTEKVAAFSNLRGNDL